MSLKLPEHLGVLGEKFRVEVKTKLHAHDDPDEPVSGETIGERRMFRVSGDLDLSRQWSTLLHEYVHGILYVVGVGNFLDEGIEEVIAQSLEHGLKQLIKEHGTQLVKAFGKEE